MLASLLMAIGIPEAFGDRALLFAGGYVGVQAIRNAFAVWASEADTELHRGMMRILGWSVLAAIPWIAGALVDDPARTAIWLGALGIEIAGPFAGYWLRWVARRRPTETSSPPISRSASSSSSSSPWVSPSS